MSRISTLLVLRLLLVLMVVATQSAAVVVDARPLSLATEAGARAEVEPSPIVPQAFNLLMDRFVFPPNSADVLNGGWSGGLTALGERGAQELPEDRPAFTNQRESDLRLFTSRYPELVEAAEGKLDKTELDRAIVRGMAASMNEGHTYYLTPEEMQAQMSRIRDTFRYAGVGISLNQERRVTDVFEDSPAEAGGIRPGDQIVAVDGVLIEGLPSGELSQRIRGEAGTPVELTIRRVGMAEPIVLRLVRAQVKVAWLSARMLDDGIGYLKIRTFPTPDALGPFREAMARFEDADIAALVIDVRGNPGGVVDSGVEVASRFIRNGPLYQRLDRSGGERTVTAFGDYWNRDTPIAVLTDGNSGSMSEILASAIRENGVGRVIGTRTAGNVAGTTPYPLQDGSGLAVTGWVIRSGLGKTLNGVGLEPDQVVELDPQQLAAGRDNQLDLALEYLRDESAARAATVRPRSALIRSPALPVGV